jgi:Ca2+-binding RTX toxin-like protein
MRTLLGNHPISARNARSGLAGLALLVGAVLVGQLGGAGASFAAVSTDPAGSKSWTSTEGGPDSEQQYTTAEAVALAQRFDMILGLKTTFRSTELTPPMKAANPNLKLIVYTNGTATQPAEATGLAESMFAHSSTGARVINAAFGNYVMNPRSTGWQTYVAAECVDFMSRMGADGCYLDDMGVGNLTTNFSAVPVDPNTGAKYDDAGWMQATSTEAAAVNAALGSKLLFANGLNNGARYFGSAQSWRMIAAADGSEAEGFVRGDSQSLTEFRKETVWKQDVDMLVDAGTRGKAVLAKTKIWIPASTSAVDRWHRYALATFLLGTDGKSYFAFNARGPGKPEAPRTLEQLDLGHPTESYAKVGGVYKRAWSKGTAYVNPTAVSATVNLGGQYTNLDGAKVSTLTLAPNTADIVKPIATAVGTCDGIPATIVGTAGPDTINGTAGRDVINGLGGDDTINGLGGDDVICGQGGADTIDAGGGNDIVIGGSENDLIVGGSGNDDLRGWAGSDSIDGGAGIDRIDGGGQSDVCVASPSDTFLSCP